MLVKQSNLAKHAAVLQCIAHDFRQLSERHPDDRETLDDFASLLDHMVASLITGDLGKTPAVTQLRLEGAPKAINGHQAT